MQLPFDSAFTFLKRIYSLEERESTSGGGPEGEGEADNALEQGA